MIPSAGNELSVKWSGILIAAAAFIITRGLLIEAIYTVEGGVLWSLPKLVPLVLGLAISVYGVDLALSTHEQAYVRTVTRWYLIGTVGMLVIVVVPTLGAANPIGVLVNESVATAVIGGGIGGVLVGSLTGRTNRQRRQLERQADQAALVNRLLRHEVLNAMTAIQGHAGLLADGRGTETSRSVVDESADRITQTIEDVGFIVRTTKENASLGEIDLSVAVQTALDRLPDRIPVKVESTSSVSVRADNHLVTAFAELLETAADRATTAPSLAVSTTTSMAVVRVTAPSEWLSEREVGALTDRLPEYDSPDVDYALSIINLLITHYGGTVRVSFDDGSTTVSLRLPRTSAGAPTRDESGIGMRGLERATVAGLIAGTGMGIVLQVLSGGLGIIGALYGSPTSALGWLTHLFHSVVFATIFAGVIAHPRVAPRLSSFPRVLGLATGFGVLLWVVAAGLIMGIWLNAVGIPASIPNLGAISFLGHAVWGALLAVALWLYPDVHD